MMPCSHDVSVYGLQCVFPLSYSQTSTNSHLSKTATQFWRTVHSLESLRTVPTNGKYFFPDNDYVRQVDHISGY